MGSAISDDDEPHGKPGDMADFESLVSDFIQNITSDTEHARAALISTEGLVRTAGDRRESLAKTVVVVVTNARLLFITPNTGMELEERSLPYGELTGLSVDPEEGNRLRAATEDERFECHLPNANPDVLDAVTRHLEWVGGVRERLLRTDRRVTQTATEIREATAEMDWERARKSYRESRKELDGLVTDVQLTTPVDEHVLAPELTDIERTLEEAHAELFLERARSQLELGQYLVEHENYDRAIDVLVRARELYGRSLGQRDAIARPDAFEFGRQRTLNEELDRLGWELETVATEPVRQAREAAVTARETEDRTTAVEHWELAFRRYDRMLELDWWETLGGPTDDIGIDIDVAVDDVRQAREEVVDRLIEIHEALGRERLERGDADTDALGCAQSAVIHLQRAHELTERFDRDPGSLADALERARRLREEIRENRGRLYRRGSDGHEPATDGTLRFEPGRFVDDRGGDERIPPSMSDTAAIRRHRAPTRDLAEIGLPDTVYGDRSNDGNEEKADSNGAAGGESR